MSEHAEGLIGTILERLRHATRRITLSELAAGALFFLFTAVSLWVVLAGAEAGLWIDVGLRTILAWTALCLLVIAAMWWIVLPLLRHVGVIGVLDKEEVARRIGRAHPDVSDRLINLLQLAEGKHSSASPEFVSAAVESLGASVGPVDFDAVEKFERPKRLTRLALIPVLVAVIMLVAAPGPFLSASGRLASPGVSFLRPDAFAISVEPGNTTVLRGSSLHIAASAVGVRVPSEVTVEQQFIGEERVEGTTIAADSTGGFGIDIPNIRKSFRYRIDAGGVTSTWYSVTVVDRPIIERLELELDYPRYSRIPRQSLGRGIGDVTALRGTLVSVDVGIGGATVSSAVIVHDNGAADTLDISGSGASGSFRVMRDGNYRVALVSTDGVANDSPIVYRVHALQDSEPTISLVAPEPTHELDESATANVVVHVGDDFGFNRLILYYRLAESRFGEVSEQMTEVPVGLQNGASLSQEILFEWRVATDAYMPVPGDVFEYYLTVWDNDSVSGYKPATTRTQRLVVPSLADRLQQLNEEEDRVEATLEELLEQANEVATEFDELKDELRQNPTPDWEDERQLERLQAKQEQLEESVQELTEQMKEIAEEMKEQGVVSEETMQLFEDFQKVMEEIDSGELQETLETLREAMENLDMQRMQEALNEFEFQEDQFQERMKRSLDLLKELRVRQGMEEVAELAEQLQEKQQELQERTSEIDEQQKSGRKDEESTADQREKIAAEQELSAEQMEELEKQLEKLVEQMKEVSRAPSESMEQMSEDMQQQDMPAKMQENADQVRENQLQPAQQGQQQMQQQLQNMQQQLGEMQSGMQGAQMQMDMEGLRRALADVLRLSEREEALRRLVDAAGGDGPRLRELARGQVELADGLRVVTDTLTHLARRVPQMSSALQGLASEGLRDMANATSSMSDRVPAQASGHQRSAMMQLNELALLLSDLLNSMNNPSGGGGSSMEEMMQQMQQMAGDQQQLNDQIQQMLNDMAGQRLSQDMQERMRSLAGQQDEMRRQLKEMSRNPELRGKALGDLNKIAQQMEETVRELERRRAGRRTIERQQEIMTRLLEATRSMQERGKEEKRESKAGEAPNRVGPDALPEDERIDALRRDLIRALEAGYAPDYEELIKRYFEELQGIVAEPPAER